MARRSNKFNNTLKPEKIITNRYKMLGVVLHPNRATSYNNHNYSFLLIFYAAPIISNKPQKSHYYPAIKNRQICFQIFRYDFSAQFMALAPVTTGYG
jgi:hypothetical protein